MLLLSADLMLLLFSTLLAFALFVGFVASSRSIRQRWPMSRPFETFFFGTAALLILCCFLVFIGWLFAHDPLSL